MEFTEELTLVRDTKATIIPAGEEHVLPTGTRVTISQALGGTVTLRTTSGLFHLPGKEWDALGEATKLALEKAAQKSEIEQGDAPFSEEQVWEAMRNCFDPEIPVNIVDLGLIYDLRIAEPDNTGKHLVTVKMTLTAQGCGMGPVIANDAKERIEALKDVSAAQVDIIWDPPWTQHMISEAGRQKLVLEKIQR